MSSYRLTTEHKSIRRAVTRRRHLDLVPTVTDAGQADHHSERAATLARQRYQTGPRFGQELAAARQLARGTAAVRAAGSGR